MSKIQDGGCRHFGIHQCVISNDNNNDRWLGLKAVADQPNYN